MLDQQAATVTFVWEDEPELRPFGREDHLRKRPRSLQDFEQRLGRLPAYSGITLRRESEDGRQWAVTVDLVQPALLQSAIAAALSLVRGEALARDVHASLIRTVEVPEDE